MAPGNLKSRHGTARNVAIALTAGLLSCCGGLAVIGAMIGPPATDTTAGSGAPASAGPPAVAVPGDAAGGTAPTAAGPPAPTTAGPPSTAPTSAAAALAAPRTGVPSTAAATAPAAGVRPASVTQTVTERQKIAYRTRTVADASLAEGTTRVRTAGVAGVRTLTYRVTVTDGVPARRVLVRSVVTREPVTRVVAVGTQARRQCHPNYGGCVPVASDVDCAGGSGNGPAYVSGPVQVTGPDVYDLDRDGDGYGCD